MKVQSTVIYTISRNNKEILVVDFSDCNENQMIELVEKTKQSLVASNKPQLLLAIFNDSAYATPKFMDAVRKVTTKFIYLIDKQAIVGLNATKKIILTGYNFLFNRNVRAFETSEEAILFLMDDSTSDRDVPDHLR